MLLHARDAPARAPSQEWQSSVIVLSLEPFLIRTCIRCQDKTSNLKSLSHIALRNGHAAANTEGAACYFQARRGLGALVFIKINPALHPAHGGFIKSLRHDFCRAQILFDV